MMASHMKERTIKVKTRPDFSKQLIAVNYVNCT